jgi:hypothetical protein
MPYREPDPSDPHVLVGVEVPADATAARDMAWVFAEEFARLGMPAARIRRLFENPFYAGAHRAWQAIGEGEINAIVDECVRVWSARRPPGG